jgi:hypothetical protein
MGTDMKRRDLLIALGSSALLAPFFGRLGRADSHKPVGDSESQSQEEVVFLFVQSSHGAKLANGKLTLKGVSPATLFFSDRPERITGHEPTEDFVSEWGEGEDSFASSPPNAVLSILVGEMPQEIVVVLKNPVLEAGDLSYDVEVLDGETSASGDASSLFIDVIGRPMSPGSVAGAHRRHRRRRRRRIARHN